MPVINESLAVRKIENAQWLPNYLIQDVVITPMKARTIGWNTPIKNKYIQSVRLSFNINNLATITGYSGLTPMINSYVVDNTLGIDDKRTYPPYRTFSVGLSVKF